MGHPPPIVLATLTEIEKELGLPAGFLFALYGEDDWSFIIKSHAVIEAWVSVELTRALKDNRLTPVFESLELSTADTGKLAFAKALGLLTDRQRRFIRRLSELRNRLVHNIRNVSFELRDYVQHLDTNQLKSFVEAVTHFVDKTDNESWNRWRQSVRNNPKPAVFASTLSVLAKTYFTRKIANLDAELAALDENDKLLDEIIGKDTETP